MFQVLAAVATMQAALRAAGGPSCGVCQVAVSLIYQSQADASAPAVDEDVAAYNALYPINALRNLALEQVSGPLLPPSCPLPDPPMPSSAGAEVGHPVL